MWILTRIFSSAVVLLFVSLLLFALCRAAPVSPARMALGADATPQQVSEFENRYGLDLPWHVQYGRWFGNATRLEFGESYVTGSAIAPEIRRTLPLTAELVTLSFIATILLSTLFGLVSALNEDSFVDHLVRIVAIIGLSIPGFWLALLLIRYGAVALGWFPPGGVVPASEGWGRHFASLALPVFSIAFYYIAVLSRLVRTNTIEALSQDYIRTATAMGLSRRRVWLYALKNALPPLASLAAMVYGYMYGWALIVEQVFNLPGISRALLTAIFQRDYPTVQGVVLVITVVFIASNTLADILQRTLSPKLSNAH